MSRFRFRSTDCKYTEREREIEREGTCECNYPELITPVKGKEKRKERLFSLLNRAALSQLLDERREEKP